MTVSKKETLNEIKQVFGVVPEWMNDMPQSALAPFWQMFRDFYLADTQIPVKYKELIGLAVSGATRCPYWAKFHTENARIHGATDEELSEAAMMGGVTMMASTFLNAQQVDEDKFWKETKQMVESAKKNRNKRKSAA